MKSISKKISLLFVLSAVLMLSSCLDSGENSYIGNQEVSYVTQGQTTDIIYAKTNARYLITSPEIELLTPGTMALISYQVTDESETVIVDDDITARKVEIAAEPLTLSQTVLQHTAAPTDILGEKFESLREPIYVQDDYFGDRWIFSYTFNIKEGENVKTIFYKASDEDAKAEDCDVLIDVRLEKLGSPEANASNKLEGDNIVVDFSSIRMNMAEKANDEGILSIKFRYNRLDDEEPYVSNKAYNMIIDQE